MSKFLIATTIENVTTRFLVSYTASTGKVTVSQTDHSQGNRGLLDTLAQSEEALAQVHLNQNKTKDPLGRFRQYYLQRGWAIQEADEPA